MPDSLRLLQSSSTGDTTKTNPNVAVASLLQCNVMFSFLESSSFPFMKALLYPVGLQYIKHQAGGYRTYAANTTRDRQTTRT
jgi:hypothetical protein